MRTLCFLLRESCPTYNGLMKVTTRGYASTKSASTSPPRKSGTSKYVKPVDKWGTPGVCKESVDQHMDVCIRRLQDRLGQLRTGRATAGHLDGISCTIGDGPAVPIVRLASVTNKDAQTLILHMYHQEHTKPVISALQSAARDFVVSSEPGRILAAIPKMTREARERMAKTAAEAAEDCKRAVRAVRNAAVSESNSAITMIDARRAAETAVHQTYLARIADIEAFLERKQRELITE